MNLNSSARVFVYFPSRNDEACQGTLEDLFSTGAIEITIFSSAGNRVKMGVQAPQQLCIWRKNAAA